MRVLIFSISFLLLSCEAEDTANCHYRIGFQNDSEQTVYVKWRRDTLYSLFGNPDPRNSTKARVESGSYNSKALFFVQNGNPTCAEYLVEPENELYIYVYDSALFNNYTWDQMKAENIYSERYDLSIEEMRQMNFEINYE